MADSKKANKSSSRANSVTPTSSERNVKKEECSEELASIGDTIEEYSDEGFDDEEGEYDEHMGDKRVRFRVGSINLFHKFTVCTLSLSSKTISLS
jgi:hypothetical protein